MQSKEYIELLLKKYGVTVPSNLINVFNDFVEEPSSIESVNFIIDKQMEILNRWKIKNRIIDINNQQIILPNASIDKQYSANFDIEKYNLQDVIIKEIQGLDETGLKFDSNTLIIEGTPIISGDFKIKIMYRLQIESENSELNEKVIPLLILVDPKSLWKNLPSNKDDIYWKEDNVSICEKLGTKKIVVSSKRGRSHQNVGSFRDDDFKFQHFEQTGWSLVSVADGAGSYPLSRKGSQLACSSVVEYFEANLESEKQKELEAKISAFGINNEDNLKKEIDGLVAQNLYQAVLFAHNKIKEHADATFISNPELFNNPKLKTPIDYYHSTLLFTLFKKYEFGYAILTFEVGDCPGAVMNKDRTKTTMLNWLDVGEFGGGTRFITQQDIFHSTEQPMISRFSFTIIEDFSFLFLMSDGIYDPKFEVEANLQKNEKWVGFLADLEGNNEDGIKIDFNAENTDIANQLEKWVDFWSKGNHDDRTLAIIF
jgi:serine/threonine protein phosphatase PrpC